MAVRGRFYVAVWLLAVLAVLWIVTARSTSGHHLAGKLDDTRRARAELEARKAVAVRRLGAAQSRATLVPRARDELGLRLPADSEIVLLPVPGPGVR